MFVNDTDFKFVISRSDNYIVLTDRPSVNASYNNPVTIDTYTQYIYPSILGFEGKSTFSSYRTFEQISVTDDFFSRADCIPIMFGGFFIVFLLCKILNIFTFLVRPKGVL